MEEQFKDIKHLVKEAGLEHPSSGFLKNVMSEVEVSSQKTLAYKPLISKNAWIIIGLIALAVLFGFAFLPGTNESVLSARDYPLLNTISIKNPLSGFVLPKTSVYGILFLGILFFVQVTLLKKRIDRSFSI